MINIIAQNPYRTLGVLSNSPLRERVGNQNRLAAFARVGKEVTFPYDFIEVITEKPHRTSEAVSTANKNLNLDKDQLLFALFWFIKGTPMDDIALKHLQSGNIDKAKEIFQMKETLASLINSGIVAFAEGDVTTGFSNISKVIHDRNYRTALLQSLGISNLTITEDDVASLFISELLKGIPAKKLLASATNATDQTLIRKRALEEPLAAINSAISLAKNANADDAAASLAAGKKLMTSTQSPLMEIRAIAGAANPQYQMIADNLAKQILQCGINYYNNAPEDDIESPRKAMELQEYALRIAVGELTKDRCRENYNILKQAVDDMPPAEVAIEARRISSELKKFGQLPDTIAHSVTLLNNTRPLLQTIKSKVGATDAYYLKLSSHVVGSALYNVIEEVNQAQNYFMAIINTAKESGIDPEILNLLGDKYSPAKVMDNKVKPVLREAWKATVLMDSFDMESDFKRDRYNPNRQSLKDMCESLGISTRISGVRPVQTTRRHSAPQATATAQKPTCAPSPNNTKEGSSGWGAFWILSLLCAIVGAFIGGGAGFVIGGLFGMGVIGNPVRKMIKDN